MKRLFFVLSLVLVCSSIFSQEKEWKVKGFEPQIRLSFDEGVDYQKNFSFGADFVAAYRFNEIIRLGAGVGVDYVNMRLAEYDADSDIAAGIDMATDKSYSSFMIN